MQAVINAVLWDFGGVITTSPFESFARYERENGLPEDFIRGLNASNHHDNAWAKLERSEVGFDEFARLYEAEAREQGHEIDARAVLACLAGDVRPEMVNALKNIKGKGLKQGCLTNNFVGMSSENPARPNQSGVLALFDAIIESSRVGVRKPEPRFYEIACDALGIEPPEAVMLDDLGVNLKPARAMGMATIKVTDAAAALDELEAALGFPVI
jgi:putative hydrolase of the HAD superfamily